MVGGADGEAMNRVAVAILYWTDSPPTEFHRWIANNGTTVYGYSTSAHGFEFRRWAGGLQTWTLSIEPIKENCTEEEWHAFQTMRLLK